MSHFSSYFTIAFRHIQKNKVFALVNVAGLSMGMAAALLIYEYTNYERSFDRFHPGYENVYRVTTSWNKQVTPDDNRATTVPWSGPNVKAAFSEVEAYTRVAPLSPLSGINSVNADGIQIAEQRVFLVDTGFFKVFPFPLIAGNSAKAFIEPASIVVTETIRKKYYGDKDPLGTVLSMKADNLIVNEFVVTGVVKDPPENTHLQFDFLISYSAIPYGLSDGSTYWHWDFTYCYLRLGAEADAGALAAKMSQLRVTQFGKDFRNWKDRIDFVLQPISSIHLDSSLRGEVSTNTDGRAIQFLSIIGICILLSAYINYFNMSTAALLQRRKEIGVRKVIGSSRLQLILQFIVESSMINIAAFVIGVFIAMLSRPLLARAFNIHWPEIDNVISFPGMITIAALLGAGIVASSLYPAMVLTDFRPVQLLNATKHPSGKPNNFFSLRHMLMVMQFIFCIGFITGALVLYRQLMFMKKHDLGMNIDQVVGIRGYGFQPYSGYEDFKRKAMFSQAVKSVGWTSAAPGDEIIDLGLRPRVSIEGVIDSAELKLVSVDANFFNTLSVELIAGRNFDPAITTDGEAVMLNESAAKVLGFNNVNDVVGRSISGIQEKPVNVIGVIRNYHQRSLKNKFEPIVFTPGWKNDFGWNSRYYFVKLDKNYLSTQGIDPAIQDLKRAWNESTPDHPFNYFFLDDRFESEYKSDVSVGRLFVFFSAFAVFIACLGLFGLVSYIAIQRTKEIGIRKILGASVNSILTLISGDFIRLMAVATLLATPGSWYLFDRWLESYAFRIDVNTALLLTPVIMLFTLSLITVIFRSYRVANANPIESIRHE